ncbi:MAG TPA: YheC/YheD family protein [Pseudogracilibacillus sp.]|nr:YheC/YheD family protein [Pseudogracilibacillus sp.]
MDTDKQLEQTKNILTTLIEATDHFTSLIKNKEYNHSFYMFSSIVEGTQAIFHTLGEEDEIFAKYSEQLVQYLTLISTELEKKRYTKVLEIVQFSLRPLYIKINEKLGSILPQTKENVAIGIYHRTHNPKDVLAKERLEATLHEAEKQDVLLYFFTENDIDFEQQTIDAWHYKDNEWIKAISPFPSVVSNIGVGKPNQAERRLSRIIPFTNTSYVGNKFSLPRRLLQHRKYADLLVPFTMCISEDKINQFIEKNDHLVFKALGSNRGENIYFVRKIGSRYTLLDQIKERILTEEQFHHFIKNVILAEKGSYIIQRYVHTRTKDDEPYHFRSHVQKNGEGQWEIVYIYPRIGNKRSNLSNISTEGRIEDFTDFLIEQFGSNQGKLYKEEILALSIDVTKHLDKLYGLSLNELGLDFAIDDEGKIWMHEANNGPQTAYHEDKRAINYIAYAKYMAQNGIMYMNQSYQNRIFKGAFQARNSNLPVINNNQSYIGILIEDSTSQLILDELIKQAELLQQAIFTFKEIDIDYDLELIRGSFYDQDSSFQKIIEYPHVIIDLVKARDIEEQPIIYEELDATFFTSRWDFNFLSRVSLYQHYETILKNTFASFQIISRPLDVFKQVEQSNLVELKPIAQKSTYDKFTIMKGLNNDFVVTNSKFRSKNYKENDLRNFIQHLIDNTEYLLQIKGKRNDIIREAKAIVVKDGDDNWTVIEDLIQQNYADDNENPNLTNLILNEVSKIEEFLNTEFEAVINEFEIEYVSLENDQIIITDINPNGPKSVENTVSYTQHLLSYAMNKLTK